jgi:predicted outer membrane repeat protein
LDITENTTVVLANCSLVNNSAVKGSALAMKHFAAVHLIGGIVSNNRAQTGAGVLLLRPAHLVVNSSVFDNNAAEHHGGGLHVQAGAVLELSGSNRV